MIPAGTPSNLGELTPPNPGEPTPPNPGGLTLRANPTRKARPRIKPLSTYKADTRVEVPFDQLVVEGYVFSRTINGISLHIHYFLHWHTTCGREIKFDDGSSEICLQTTARQKTTIVGARPEGYDAHVKQCKEHTSSFGLVWPKAGIDVMFTVDGGLTWRYGGSASSDEVDTLQALDPDEQYDKIRPHFLRKGNQTGWPTREQFGDGISQWRHDWDDSVVYSIESALTFDATAEAQAEALALREHGKEILAGLTDIADGKLGDDTQPARESWLSTMKQVEVHSPLFFKNLLKEYKETHGNQIGRLTARERARNIRGQVESHVSSSTQRLNLQEAMAGVRSPENGNEFSSRRQAQNALDVAMLEAAHARLDRDDNSADDTVPEIPIANPPSAETENDIPLGVTTSVTQTTATATPPSATGGEGKESLLADPVLETSGEHAGPGDIDFSDLPDYTMAPSPVVKVEDSTPDGREGPSSPNYANATSQTASEASMKGLLNFTTPDKTIAPDPITPNTDGQGDADLELASRRKTGRGKKGSEATADPVLQSSCDLHISPPLKDTIGEVRTGLGLGLELPFLEDSALDRVAAELRVQAQVEHERRRAEGAAKRAEAEQKALVHPPTVVPGIPPIAPARVPVGFELTLPEFEAEKARITEATAASQAEHAKWQIALAVSRKAELQVLQDALEKQRGLAEEARYKADAAKALPVVTKRRAASPIPVAVPTLAHVVPIVCMEVTEDDVEIERRDGSRTTEAAHVAEMKQVAESTRLQTALARMYEAQTVAAQVDPSLVAEGSMRGSGEAAFVPSEKSYVPPVLPAVVVSAGIPSAESVQRERSNQAMRQQLEEMQAAEADAARRLAESQSRATPRDTAVTYGTDQPMGGAGGNYTEAPVHRARGYDYNRDTGRQTREAGVYMMDTELERKVSIMGNAYMGGLVGCNLWTMANAKLNKVKDELHMEAHIRGTGSSFENSTFRNKLIFASMGKSYSGSKGWQEGVETVKKVYNRNKTTMLTGTDRLRWAEPAETPAAAAGNAMPMNLVRMTSDYQNILEMNEFVVAAVNAGKETQVMSYMSVFLDNLAEAEKECRFCPNAVIMRQNALTTAFVNNSCIDPNEMYKHGMYDTVGLAGSKMVSVKDLKAVQAELDLVREAMDTYPGQCGPPQDVARELRLYRSHQTNLEGKAYVNHRNTPYQGSVCDHCEQLRAGTPGISYHHHPLRCRRSFGKDCSEAGQEPEVLDPQVTFYIRGNKKGRMKADGTVTVLR